MLLLKTFYARRYRKQSINQEYMPLLQEHERKYSNRRKEKRSLTGHKWNGFLFYAVMPLTVPLFDPDFSESKEEFFDPTF